MFPPWITPVLCWNLIQSLTGLTVAFTASDSRVRPLVAALTALLAYTLQTNIQTHFAGTRPSGPLVAMCWVNVLNAMDLLVLRRASYEAQLAYRNTKAKKKEKPTTSAPNSQTIVNKLFFALELPYNYRRINTPWANARPLARPTSTTATPQTSQKSKSTFLLHSTLTLLVSGAIIHLLTLDPSSPHLNRALSNLDTAKSVLLLPLRAANNNAHALLVQILFTLSFGLVTRAAIIGGHTSVAILAVLILGDDPANWPPIFEPLSQACSLRGLWGKSWHQILRVPLTSNATFLASLLGLAPTSRGAHWLRVVIAFTGSGIIHSLCDIGFGVPLDKTGGIYFYTLQIGGFVVESVVSTVYARLRKTFGLRLGRNVEGVVGYIWVLVFLAWSTPVWINPILVSLAADGTRVMSPWLGLNPTVYEL
ncbi:membrane bound O-acyl transferase family-domain-containing protein [Aspergillus pseudoustus]|uniref:Membrane bound O-acyl transferase family-domain-containing protein n=1 Tax=Aspergillus pseudoustus TaxID=1810923 RepID=A0ABR4JAJ7_9EURO